MPFKNRASGNMLWGCRRMEGGGGGAVLQNEEEELKETAGFPALARPGAPKWIAKAKREKPEKQS